MHAEAVSEHVLIYHGPGAYGHGTCLHSLQLSGPLTSPKSESDSVRRNSETKMPHKLNILKVTWANILWGKSYCARRGFGAQTGPPGGPQRSENSQKPTMQNPGNQILRMSMGRSADLVDSVGLLAGIHSAERLSRQTSATEFMRPEAAMTID